MAVCTSVWHTRTITWRLTRFFSFLPRQFSRFIFILTWRCLVWLFRSTFHFGLHVGGTTAVDVLVVRVHVQRFDCWDLKVYDSQPILSGSWKCGETRYRDARKVLRDSRSCFQQLRVFESRRDKELVIMMVSARFVTRSRGGRVLGAGIRTIEN